MDNIYIKRTWGMGTEYHIMKGNIVLYSSCYEEVILKKFKELKGIDSNIG